MIVHSIGQAIGNGSAPERSLLPTTASLTRGLGLLLFYGLATVIIFRQWIPDLDQILLGPPEDNMQDFWNSWYVTVAANYHSFFSTNLIHYPEGTPLWYHSFSYPQIFVTKLLSHLFGSDLKGILLIHNITILMSVPIAGLGAYYLVRHLSGSVFAALIGGFIFAFNPSHVQHIMHHAHVASISFIPFFVLYYLKASQDRSIKWIIAAILFYALSALSCWYYLFYNAYFIVFHIIFEAIRQRRWPSLARLAVPAMILAGTGALLSPLLVPMVKQALTSATVYADGSALFVADLVAYVAFPPQHLLAGLTESINARLTGNLWEGTVYLGLANILILGWVTLKAPSRNRALMIYVLCGMATFCVIASGDYLHVAGASTVPMPGFVLSHLPFVRNVRTPSRAIVIVYLFMAIGVGHAVALLSVRERPLARAAVVGLIALIILDFYPSRLESTPFVCAPGLQIIRDDPDPDFGVLDLPAEYSSQNHAMMQQACHLRPIVNGIVSRDVEPSLRDRLEFRDLQQQRRQLIAAKVKYVVITKPNGRAHKWRAKDGDQEAYATTYEVVFESPRNTILKVYRSPPATGAGLGGGTTAQRASPAPVEPGPTLYGDRLAPAGRPTAIDKTIAAILAQTATNP